MTNKQDIYEENKYMVIMLLIPIAILAKLIEHLLLPDKYFFDGSRMLLTMINPDFIYAWGGNYQVTVDFFNKINIFGFTSLLQWSIFLGVIFNIVLVSIFLVSKGMSFVQSVFALMCIGLCNIYVFNLGKDIIQFGFFIMCFAVIKIKYIPNSIKVIGCALVFYWESTFFRNYYIIMAAFTIVVYLLFELIRNNKPKLNVWKILLIVGMLLVFMFMFLKFAQIFMPSEYAEVMECKYGSTQLGASTTIDDKIKHNGNLFLYMQNYIINFARMLIPIELISGGVFYFPFLLFQILLLYYLYLNIKNIHNIDSDNVISLAVFIAFFLGSVLFEPDFGSFARHEAAAFPIIILFALDNMGLWKNKENTIEEKRVVIYE